MDDPTNAVRQPPPEPQRRGRWSSADEPGRSRDELGGEPPVLVRAEAHLRSPLLDTPPTFAAPTGNEDWIRAIRIPRAIRPYVILIVAIGIAVSFVANPGLGLAAAAFATAALVMRGVGRRMAFEFADGFLAFRDRDGWPHGVQEEYDVRYSWPSTARVSPGR